MNDTRRAALRTLTNISLAAAAMSFFAGGVPASAADKVIVGLITKTNSNPFFVKMKEGAAGKAKELDVDLRTLQATSTATTRLRSQLLRI
jgi:fructose transport system substrate-binding protein